MDDVDIVLVLAFDTSASVTYEEFDLMARGCGAALRDPDVIAGLTNGPSQASLCALVLWSGHDAQETLIDWTHVTDTASLEAFAQQVEDVPRVVKAGGTAIGEALVFCERLIALAPAKSRRTIIDVAGDGKSNEGVAPGPVRDRLAANGITINGLCILHEEPDLLASFQSDVIGGPAAFALTCHDFGDFKDAIRQKLQQEVATAGPNRSTARA